MSLASIGSKIDVTYRRDVQKRALVYVLSDAENKKLVEGYA
jgi:hypothetical protein